MWAIVPLKNLENVKTRLSPVLSPAERGELFLCMAEDVLAATIGTTELQGTLVISRDDRMSKLAKALGAVVLEEPKNTGHSAAVTFGAHWLKTRGEKSFLQIPADVPLVLPKYLSRLIQSHNEIRSERKISIVPSHDQGGSNCVICTPPDVMPLQFGIDSFRRHLEAAEQAGIQVEIKEVREIALDIDDPHDLERFAAMPSTTRTHRFIVSTGISARLNLHDKRKTA